MRKRWKQILAAGMSAIMLAQPVMTYASELTENIEVQDESGLENDEQVNIQQENLENDEQVNIEQESDEVWYEDTPIEETEITIESEGEISDEQINTRQENDDLPYEDELIEETEVTIGAEDEIYDEQYTEEEESDPQDVIEDVELETEENSEDTVDIIEEAETLSELEEETDDELYDEDTESAQELFQTETETETEDGSEFIVEEETESETSDLIATYANVNNLVYIDGIYAGTLEQVNWPQSGSEKFELVIDGVRYNITNNVDLIIDRYAGEQVVYTLANGKIDNIEPVSELLQPSVSINATPDSFFYQNGSYNTDKITATVNIYCIYQTYSQYFGASKYTKEELGKIEGLYVPVKQVDLKIGDHLNFGTKGMILKKEITEVSEKQISLSLKNPISYKYDIYVDKKYVPTETNVKSVLSATLVKTDDSVVKCKDAVISIGSQEQQQKQLVAKDSNTDKNKAFTEMQNKLMNCTAIALDAKLDEHFSKEQIDEMKRFIAVYVAEVINADHMEDPGFFQQVSDNLRKKVRDNILKKLHVSYNSLLFYETKEIVINMEAETKNNGQEKIKLDIPIGSISSGDESPFGAWGPINYSVSAGASTLISGEGMITYANMEAFSKTMLNYLEIAYKEAWGNDANKIASMFVGEPINTLMDGDYSGKIYKLARKAATGEKTNVKSEAAKQTSNFIYRYVKKAIIHCPVNVYVYDEHDNLCASVVDDTIVNNNNEIFLVVNDDEKYVYLTKDNYKIRLEGTDQGTMEYAIQEYQDGECIRSVCTKNIPLEKGTEYTAIVPAVPRIDSSLYRLKNKNNNEIVETSDTYDDSIGDEITSPVKSIKACGKCGDSAYWVLYEDGTMIIYGTGDMSDGGSSYSSDTGWYYYRSEIKKVEIKEGITSIGRRAFGYCSDLENITIPDSVTEIGATAFECCQSLITVTGGSKLKEIGDYAFSDCIQLNSITIPASVSECDSAFEGCTNLKTAGPINGNYNIKLGFTERIPLGFFSGSEIEEVIIPDTVKRIEENAFRECHNLKRVKLPSELLYIGSWAFYNSGVESLTIPNTVEKIACRAFEECTQLNSITIPASVRECSIAFEGCTNLKTAGPINGNYNIKLGFTERIPVGFFSGSEIEEVIIPDTVKRIELGAFYECYNLKKVKLSTALTYIGEVAFYNCDALESLTIPNTVKEIGSAAFAGHPDITISVYEGSYAERYAIENSYPYILLDENGEVKHEHVWDAGEVTKSATCIENGRKIYECIYCRETKQEDIPATGKHSFGSYVVVKQPTVLANGTKTRTCSFCGKKESLSVSKLKGKIRLTKTALTLKSKGTTQLSGIVTGMAKGDYIKSYVSDNTKIVAVNSKGLVTAKAVGKANIKITLASGVTATVKITVQPAKIATTKLQVASSVKLTVGQKKKLAVTVTPKNTTDKVTYVSANKSIATVSSNGTITAKKAGKTKITVKSGSKKATVTITVVPKAPTGIKGIPTKQTLKKGKTLALKAKLVPTGAEAKITYKSSNTKVATVDAKGNVKAKKAGTAVITVMAGKVKTTCKITVK